MPSNNSLIPEFEQIRKYLLTKMSEQQAEQLAAYTAFLYSAITPTLTGIKEEHNSKFSTHHPEIQAFLNNANILEIAKRGAKDFKLTGSLADVAAYTKECFTKLVQAEIAQVNGRGFSNIHALIPTKNIAVAAMPLAPLLLANDHAVVASASQQPVAVTRVNNHLDHKHSASQNNGNDYVRPPLPQSEPEQLIPVRQHNSQADMLRALGVTAAQAREHQQAALIAQQKPVFSQPETELEKASQKLTTADLAKIEQQIAADYNQLQNRPESREQYETSVKEAIRLHNELNPHSVAQANANTLKPTGSSGRRMNADDMRDMLEMTNLRPTPNRGG
jgi:hypothetical protein